ncbi:hypothetical protein SAMN05421730_1003204 [Anaerobium acetethylicum]|uniref:Uncharacterized protein n=1 Tax=Anaerobium acetethylicum TaxID=1619234 RepID=A0A1D3TR34_9FIRM|nr:hypothetical protein SAMN05421730_1003204 [Anaerobium acetethylicum]
MKTLALRPRILRPYVPLRLHLSESALRINMFCITSSLLKLVQIDEYYFVNGLLTHHSCKAKKPREPDYNNPIQRNSLYKGRARNLASCNCNYSGLCPS